MDNTDLVTTNPSDLKDWLHDFLDRCTGDPCSFFAVLKRHGGDANARDPLNHVEQDRAELFREFVTDLISVMGSEQAVIRWLGHSEAFESVGASSPLFYIEEGDIWCLHLLRAVLRIWAILPYDALGVRSEVLRSQLNDHPELLTLFEAAFGSAVPPEEWFFKPAIGLGGARPIDALNQVDGVRQVCRYLAQIDAGSYV